MSSLHIHLHLAPSCHHREPARHPGADKALQQGMAAMIVLALLERLARATAQGGAALRAGHGAGHDAGHGTRAEGCGPAGHAAPVAPRSQEGERPTGVLPQFMALLILLALLCGQKGGHKGGHGGANHLADGFAGRLADRLAGPPADKRPAQEAPEAPAPEAPATEPATEPADPAPMEAEAPSQDEADAPFEDPVSMMTSAMREGRAKSLLAGRNDAAFEHGLQAMASDLRQQLNG